MASTRASISKVSKRPKINIIPPKQLFVDLTQDDTKTPSPKLPNSSPSAPNAPSKTPSTKDTSSSSIDYIPKSPTSSTSPSPNGYLNPSTSPPLRVSPPPPTQDNASMDITLTLSPNTPLDVQFDTPSPSPPIIAHPIPWNFLEAHVEAIHMILNGIRDNIYSTVDACPSAKETWETIERLQQGNRMSRQSSGNLENLLQETENQLSRTTQEWSRFITIVKQATNLDTELCHKLFDILKQYQNEVNEIRAEMVAKNANPLTLNSCYYKKKGKKIVKPPSPQSESASEEDSDKEQAQRDKQMHKRAKMWILLQELGMTDKLSRMNDFKTLMKSQMNKNWKHINDTYLVENTHINVTPNSSNMCDNEGKADQNVDEPEDERVMLASLITNLKLDFDENKMKHKKL
ncbi:hypothetical protein Tco_1384320 [Tanacetum coccineum]